MEWASAASTRRQDPSPTSWRPFEAPLRSVPVRSGSSLVRKLGGYALATLALCLEHSLQIRMLAIGVLPAAFLFEFRRWLAGPLPGKVRALVLRNDQSWVAELKDGSVTDVELVQVLRVSPCVIRIRVRLIPGGRCRDLSFAADALSPAAHRRLRVRLS